MRLIEPATEWVERRVRAMGSTAHLIVADAPEPLLDWALDELVRLEQAWSRFLPDSELTRCNARPGEWVEVSAAMFEALIRARELWEVTGGAFDPTTLTALERAGYDRSFTLMEPDDPRRLTPAEPAPGYGAVMIDPAARAVRLPVGTRVDLGGIGKGLAADLVACGLVDRGARSALVSVGGDMRACGEPPAEGGWNVPVEHPLDDARVAFTYSLVNEGLVTSTTRIRRWTRGGMPMHHIVDPASGAPTESDLVAVVAAARDAWWAEGVAKAMIVRGLDGAAALASRARVRAWCYLGDGHVVEINARG